jgi:Amidohydrolase family
VTAVPASAAGVEHRIGVLAKGTDADVVLWDSHPLHIGATPVKVWIDGILQIPVPLKTGEKGGNVIVGKGKDGQEWREIPSVPNWDKERKKAVEWDGLPPLEGEKESSTVVFKNVREVWTRGSHGVVESFYKGSDELGVVLVKSGKIICAGTAATCVPTATPSGALVDLHGGSISPGLMSFGSPLGLEEIAGEPSTGNGVLYNSLVEDIPRVFGDVSGIMRAVDALQFGTRNALSVLTKLSLYCY